MPKVKKCPECGFTVQKSFNFCPDCGTNLRKKSSTGSSKQQNSLSTIQILSIFLALVIVAFGVLYLSGVFDQPEVQKNNQVQNVPSGVDLNNVNQINELEVYVQANPDDHPQRLKLAHMLFDAGFHDRAIGHYIEYLKFHPNDVNVIVDLGVSFFNLKQFAKADSIVNSAIKLQPNHQIANYNLGIINLSIGNIQEADEWFKKAMDINPNSETGKQAKELLESH